MTDKTLETLISRYMKTEQPQYVFGWQGGEPTIMGIDFFKQVIKLQIQYAPKGASIANGLQTNGTLISEELAAHFGKYKFLLGVSLDGPPEIHDHYRYATKDRGSFDDAMRGIGLLKKHEVEFNILTLVSQSNVKKGGEVFQFLCDNGFFFHQYIPCVEFDKDGGLLPFAITGEEWGDFMCQVFDAWMAHGPEKVSVRLFDSILSQLVRGTSTICHAGKNCCQYFVVEYNGDVYPCDFFVTKETRLGNVNAHSWKELQKSNVYISFGKKKTRWPRVCAECPHLVFCAGDCLKHRISRGGLETRPYLCEGWKRFYNHAMPGFRKIAERIGK